MTVIFEVFRNPPLHPPPPTHFHTANPAVIANSPYRQLKMGPLGGNFPRLTAFVSGTPTPTANQQVWHFGGSTDYPPGAVIAGSSIILTQAITAKHAGMYTFTVTTSAGTASTNYILVVIRESLPLNSTPSSLAIYLFEMT